MAKVGNEVKLILRLAEERAKKQYEYVQVMKEANFAHHYQQGMAWYTNELLTIVSELESK